MCYKKAAEESVKEAASGNQDDHIPVKVQDADLAVPQARYHASVGEATLRGRDTPGSPQRHTLKLSKSKLPTRPNFSTSSSMLKAASYREERRITLGKKYAAATFHRSYNSQ